MRSDSNPRGALEEGSLDDELARPFSLANHKTKTDLVYEALKQAIVEGRYPAGSRIVADQLAQELGISKVPIREAIVRLVGEGWLQVKPHVGAVVPEMSPDEILDQCALRAAVEGLATRLAADYITPPILDRLHVLLERMDKAATDNPLAYPKLNLDFHSTAFQCCPYPSLRTMAASLAEKTYRLAPIRLHPEYLPESQAQHRELLAALESHRGEEVESLVRHHVERSGKLLWQTALELAGGSGRHFLHPSCFCGRCSPERSPDMRPQAANGHTSAH